MLRLSSFKRCPPWLVTLVFWSILVVHALGHAAKCPNLLIVLDKSGSMTDGPSGGSAPPGGQKWDLAKKAVYALLDRYDGELPIGLSLFAGDGVCGAGKVEIPCEYGSKAKIRMKIDQASPDSATPTSETIENLRKETLLKDASRGQYLLLLTDGEPTCASGEPQATVTAIENAKKQNPSLTTFVVGFGALPGSAADAMDRMAEAGGKPVVGKPRKFYQAENLESLNAALDEIFKIVVGESAMGCDDSCYAPDVGCKNPGDLCIRGECKPNPCTGVTCGPGQYCFTDGVQQGRCVAACSKRCSQGQRCEMGRCVSDACGQPCIPGFVCNRENKRCEPDPLCPSDRPRKEQCRPPSQCQFGTCIDDPCLLVKCPKDTRCVSWNGSCEFTGAATAPDMAQPSVETDEVGKRSGCSAGTARVPAGMALGTSLLVGLLLGLSALQKLARRSRRP